MTTVAKLFLAEAEANALAAAIDENDRLSPLPLSLGEVDGEKWLLTVYLSGEDDAAESAALRKVAFNLLGRAAPFDLEALPDADWVAKSLEGLKPVRAGRFLVHGGHDRGRRRPNDIAIEIEAGEAFGTGHHGTTAGCLAAIDRLARVRPLRNALDVGTGSGVLAIAIARAAKVPVLASDIDPVAVRVARGNVRLNGVARYVTSVEAADLEKRIFAARAPFDLIVANILARPLVALAPAIARRLAPGGTLILSGLLPDQRARVLAAYRGQGLALARSEILDGWLTLTFTKLRSLAYQGKFASMPFRRVFRSTP